MVFPSQSIEYNKSVITELESINEPLERNFGIFLFTYRKLSKGGSLLHLTTQKNWIEQSLENNLLMSGEITPKIIQTMNNFKQSYLWSGNRSDPVYKSLYEFNIWNGITFYQNYEDYIEMIAFATTKDNSQALNFYINNFELLNHFKAHFKEKASHILSSDAFRKLSVNVQDKISILKITEDLKNRHVDFIKKTSLSRYYFSGKHKHIYLTKRQAEVLFYLAQGKTSKQIAKILKNRALDGHSISDRTVEAYWNTIKSKFRSSEKDKIIDIFIRSDIYNDIFYLHKIFDCDQMI